MTSITVLRREVSSKLQITYRPKNTIINIYSGRHFPCSHYRRLQHFEQWQMNDELERGWKEVVVV
jgi:hypothetical protein